MIDDETHVPQRGTGIWNEIENRCESENMCEESVKKDAHHLVFVLTTVFVLYPLSFEIKYGPMKESRHIYLSTLLI